MDSLCFDVTGAAALGFNYFNRHRDRRSGFIYIWTYLLTDPPKSVHEPWDLVEEMTNSEEGLERELWCRDKLLELQDPKDALIYRPKTPYSVRMADVYDQASALHGLVMRYLADKDPACEKAIERNLAAVEPFIAWDGDDYARVSVVAVKDGTPLERYTGQVLETDNPEEVDEAWMGRFIPPLVMYAKATGKERPLVLARALARDVAFRSGRYGEDGSFNRARHGEDSVWSNGHFHSRANTMAGALRVARETGDKDLAEWAETVFRWALTQGTDFGWFGEFVGRRDIGVEGCETCGVVDMLDAAILLAKSGREDCWDIADRIWRNQLLESQLRDISWVKSTRTPPESEIESFDRVPERAVGGFAGWSGPNDLISDYPDRQFASKDPSQDHRRSLMGCCCASGPKGLYLAWHHALERSADGVTVNFALSRESDVATVRSYEPYEGLVEVTMKRAGTLRFRVPGRVDLKDVSAARNDEPATSRRERDLLAFPGLEKGDLIRIAYPLAQRTETVTVGDPEFYRPIDYRITWHGNTVIAVDPQGEHCPLYQRDAARTEHPPGDPPTGPVPTNEIDW